MGVVIKVAELDFTSVENNLSVQKQGVVTCIWDDVKGWYSPAYGRFVSRQDLAVVSGRRKVEL